MNEICLFTFLALLGYQSLKENVNISISPKGFNSKTVLTVADSKKRTNIGSAEMRNNLKYDTDMGIDLVQDVNGYVFVLDNFVGAKPPVKKQYITVLTNVLADNISRTEVSSDCVCQLNYGLYAEEKCEVKETKFLPAPVSFVEKLKNC
jgi:hypothetical protein